MEKKIKKIFVIAFVLLLSVFMIFTLTNNTKYSSTERRYLTTFPKLKYSNLLTKNYYDKITEAFKDQLFLRNHLVKGYFLLNFQRYFGNVVKGSNNQLYSPRQGLYKGYYEELKEVTYLVNEEAKKTNTKFIFLSIPRKDAYMRDDLPKNYISSYSIYKKQVEIVKENLDNEIIFIDAYDVFQNANIYNCYYSNDHHTTPRCAYLLLQEINKYTETETYDLDNTFEIKKSIVNGAYNRQLGQTVKSEPEDLYVVPKITINYTRYENGKLSKKKVFGKGTSYESAYMEGDMAYTRIITDTNSNKRILYVGSSYTNILEALSVPSYKVVASVDYRHNKTGKSIKDYVKENNIDYVVFIPAQSTNSFSIKEIKEHLGK